MESGHFCLRNSLNRNTEKVYQADFGTGGGCITFNPAINKVYIDGVVENAANGGTIFTLPAEYRPKKNLVFYNPCRQNGVAALYNLTIQTDGQVKANAFTNIPMTELRISASFIK